MYVSTNCAKTWEMKPHVKLNSVDIMLYVLQTPTWDESDLDENLGTRHKRSNSWGSADQKIKEASIRE